GEGRGTEMLETTPSQKSKLAAEAPNPKDVSTIPASSKIQPPWTHSQRVVLIVLLSGLLVYLSVRLLLNPMYVSDPQPLHPRHDKDLKNRTVPNTADVKTLAALPMIGEKRARDIVAYRERFTAQWPGEPAYKRPEDLMKIKGIGRAMVQTIEPFLICSTTQ